MLDLTLLEKLQILLNLILNSPLFIFLFIFTILVFIILLDIKNYKIKQVKKYIVGIYALVFIITIIKYNSAFLSLFDYLIDNVFVLFYFPNIVIYALVIIIVNIIMLKSLFKDNNKFMRTLNIGMYIIIMYLMILVINVITTEGLNVYDEVSLYTNESVLALVELSNSIALIWLGIYLITKVLDILDNKDVIKLKKNTGDNRVVTKYIEKEKIVEVPVEKEKIVEVPVEKIIYKDGTKQEDIFTKEELVLMLNILKNNKKN